MSIILVAVLIIGGLVGAVAVVVAIPLISGLVAFDLFKSDRPAPRQAKVAASVVSSDRVSMEHGFARAFVVAGGVFWSVAIFAGLYSFRQTGMVSAVLGAFFPLVAVLVTLVIGWYYERVAAALLAFSSLAVVAWGVIYQFELGVWVLMTLALIGPMLVAAVLFWMARRDQDAFELAMADALELAPVASTQGPTL